MWFHQLQVQLTRSLFQLCWSHGKSQQFSPLTGRLSPILHTNCLCTTTWLCPWRNLRVKLQKARLAWWTTPLTLAQGSWDPQPVRTWWLCFCGNICAIHRQRYWSPCWGFSLRNPGWWWELSWTSRRTLWWSWAEGSISWQWPSSSYFLLASSSGSGNLVRLEVFRWKWGCTIASA